MDCRTGTSVQEVLGHVLGCQFRRCGPGGPRPGMHGRRLSRAVRRAGRRLNVPAGRAGLAIRGKPRPRRRAHSGRGLSWPQPGGRLPTPRPHRALLSGGGGRLLRRGACRGGRALWQGAVGVTDRIGLGRPGGPLWLRTQLPWRFAHGIGYEAQYVRLGERGAVRARGGIFGGQRVLSFSALDGIPRVHGQVVYGTADHTVDGRRKAAWRGRYCTQGSADYRTRRQRLRVGPEG